jgi:hypothetical protein
MGSVSHDVRNEVVEELTPVLMYRASAGIAERYHTGSKKISQAKAAFVIRCSRLLSPIEHKEDCRQTERE